MPANPAPPHSEGFRADLGELLHTVWTNCDPDPECSLAERWRIVGDHAIDALEQAGWIYIETSAITAKNSADAGSKIATTEGPQRP